MADERIAIYIVSSKCRNLREVKEGYSIVKEDGLSDGTYCSAYIHGNWQKIDPEKDCKDCKRAEYNGLSRTEAVERMAKALHSRSTVISDMEKDWEKLDESWQDSFFKYAEAALDALIKQGD